MQAQVLRQRPGLLPCVVHPPRHVRVADPVHAFGSNLAGEDRLPGARMKYWSNRMYKRAFLFFCFFSS